MSQFREVKKVCAICGKEHEFIETVSYYSNGYMDFDTREPVMDETIFFSRIQLCTYCYYASGDISSNELNINIQDLQAENYQKVAQKKKMDKTAKAYLLSAHLHALKGQEKVAGLLFLNAAWRFDDLDQKDYAIRARKKAIVHLTVEVEATANIHLATIIVDMYRRIGGFDDALEAAEQLLDFGVDELLGKILKKEIELIKNKDIERHNLGEVLA